MEPSGANKSSGTSPATDSRTAADAPTAPDAPAATDAPTAVEETDAPEIASSATGRPPVQKPRAALRPFWDDFTTYTCPVRKVKRAKCKYCISDYACDSNLAGSSNVSKHWAKCKGNPRNQGQGSNDVACNFIKEVAKKHETITKGEHLQVRCIAHIINLVVQDGIAFGGKHIAKIRAMAKYVRGSAGRKSAFKILVRQHEIEYKGSVKNDVPTRWNSTYLMLESVLKYRTAFEFAGMDIPALREGTELGPMTLHDWERCENLREFLKGFYDLTKRISRLLYITSNWLVFHIKVCLKLLNSLAVSEDLDLRMMGYQMKLKYDKYFGEMKKLNLLMFVATILDPYNKMRGVTSVLRGLFGESELESSVKTMKDFAYKLFDTYKEKISPQANRSSQSRASGETDWMNVYDLRDDAYECDDSLRSEFDLYLADRSEPDKTDVLDWWSKNHQRYPILA